MKTIQGSIKGLLVLTVLVTTTFCGVSSMYAGGAAQKAKPVAKRSQVAEHIRLLRQTREAIGDLRMVCFSKVTNDAENQSFLDAWKNAKKPGFIWFTDLGEIKTKKYALVHKDLDGAAFYMTDQEWSEAQKSTTVF